MNIKENRWLARIVLAAVIVACILLSGGGRLKALRSEALDVFYAQDGIDFDLTRRCESAQLLAALAQSYGLDEAAIARVQTAAEAASGDGDIAARGKANRDLTLAADQLYTLMEQADLSDADADYAYSLYKDIQSRAQIMARSEYDAMAAAYNQKIKSFPAGVIASIMAQGELPSFH